MCRVSEVVAPTYSGSVLFSWERVLVATLCQKKSTLKPKEQDLSKKEMKIFPIIRNEQEREQIQEQGYMHSAHPGERRIGATHWHLDEGSYVIRLT